MIQIALSLLFMVLSFLWITEIIKKKPTSEFLPPFLFCVNLCAAVVFILSIVFLIEAEQVEKDFERKYTLTTYLISTYDVDKDTDYVVFCEISKNIENINSEIEQHSKGIKHWWNNEFYSEKVANAEPIRISALYHKEHD